MTTQSRDIKMAACSKTGGYQCEFLGAFSDDFVCGLCRNVVREPQLTSCCTETFCKACITPVLEDKKPCPSCETVGFTTWLNVKYERRILALEVRCTMKDRGCEWTGKLEGLKAHLDVNTGDCEYVDVECPNGCDQPVEKCNLPTHLANSCSKREFTCQYCNFKATYAIVCDDHWPQCSFYPVPCPKACGIQAIERGDLEAHLLQCPLEEVECDFSHAGCNTKLPRQDLERHMEESTQKHLVLISVSQQKTTRDFDRELKVRDRQIAELQEQLQKTTQENEVKIRDLQQQLQRKVQQVEVLETFVYMGEASFSLTDFKQHKDKKDWWYSPPLYTHSGGYKFRIGVSACGFDGTDVEVSFETMEGEKDDQLKWPARYTVILQLLNQERDCDHVNVTEVLKWQKLHAPNLIHPIISHKDLEYNPQKQTHYLKNDRLLFRIAKVKKN